MNNDQLYPARYWHKLDDGRIQCDVCPRFCKLNDGQRGLCFVRARAGNQLVLTTYGRSSGFCIDPIEKKPLNHFYPGTSVLSFGTAGCNLTCKFCQNWDISKSRDFDRLQSHATPESIAQAALDQGCKSVAFTYNDPVIFMEYAIDVAKACHDVGLNCVAVTAGYIQGPARAEFFKHMDAANVDLKAFTQSFYKKMCTADLDTVLDTLVYLKNETDVWFEITDLLIPDENDGVDEIAAMCEWINENLGDDVPLHFSAFHPDWKMLDKTNTPKSTLERARATAKNQGIKHVYLGNVHDLSGSSTYCHQCGETLIGRDWYELSTWNLSFTGNDRGNCSRCGSSLPGRFDGGPGDWGRKRQIVDMKPYQSLSVDET